MGTLTIIFLIFALAFILLAIRIRKLALGVAFLVLLIITEGLLRSSISLLELSFTFGILALIVLISMFLRK